MNLRRYAFSAILLALMPSFAAQSEDTKDSAGNLEKAVGRDIHACGVDPSVIGREGIGKKTKIMLRRQFHSPHLPEQYCYWCSLSPYARSFWYTAKALQIVDDFDEETLEETGNMKEALSSQGLSPKCVRWKYEFQEYFNAQPHQFHSCKNQKQRFNAATKQVVAAHVPSGRRNCADSD